ncbi:MAG TPA: vWA domain-containing protein [Longimicrobium sp.]|nr:vWA domain-containing protein [Longimicrobium sp.]
MRRLSWGLLATLLFAVRIAHAQTRTVAVVYDDSGSMGNPQNPTASWRYANYALQTFVGLLAPRDALSVVRMSAPTTPVAIDLGSQATQIAAIRATPHAGGGTPYDAVQTAMETLAKTAREQAAAGTEVSEKWLIIITDGQFTEDALTPEQDAALRDEIRRFLPATGARTVLLLIGDLDDAVTRVWEEEAQARRYEAQDRSQIVERMRQIAADITSRSDQPLPVTISGSTATLDTELPLRRVTLLQHEDDAARLAALQRARTGAEALRASEPLALAMPLASADRVFGRIHHVQGARPDAVIPGGRVTLELDRPVTAQQLQVLPEVAARLEVWLTDGEGRPLPVAAGVHEVCSGEPFHVRATLLSPTGDTLVRQVRRPEQFRLEGQYGAQRAPLAAGRGAFFERAFASDERPTPVSVSAAYPGYFNYRSRVFTVRGVECRPRALALRTLRPFRGKVTELEEAPPAEVAPTADGLPVAADELARWTLTRVDDERLKVDVERSPVGWRLKPRKTWGLACCTPTGTIPVEVEAKSPNPREPAVRLLVPVEVEDASFWAKCGWLILTALALLLLAWYLIRLFRKRRFCPGSEIVYQRFGRAAGRPVTYGLPGKNLFIRWLVPTKAERRSVEGVTFEAGMRCSYILIPPEAQTEDMRVAGEPVEDPGRRPLRLAQGDQLEVRRGAQREVYTYSGR